jgi:endonuclease/exonuclease/phosphatase family metal-dependent hydrolase
MVADDPRGVGSEPLPPRTLRIATYNVHGCVGTDGVLDPDRVAEVIRSLDADLVGLQEVDCRQRFSDGTTQLERLARQTGMHAESGPTIVEASGFFGNALLTRYDVGAVHHVDVSVAGREPRGLLEVSIDLETPLRVLVTHFGLRSHERKRQVDAVLDRLHAPGPMVLLGDFNEWHSRAAALLRLHSALGRPPPVRSFPSRWPIFALDRIWVRPFAALMTIDAPTSRLARKASDHLPVCAEIDPQRLFAATHHAACTAPLPAVSR